MSTEKFLSINSVKPMLYKLLEKILQFNTDERTPIKAIKNDLWSRYQVSSVKHLFNLAILFDPRYKRFPF